MPVAPWLQGGELLVSHLSMNDVFVEPGAVLIVQYNSSAPVLFAIVIYCNLMLFFRISGGSLRTVCVYY